MSYLPQIRILVPTAQVSTYTTGSFSLPSARGALLPLPTTAIFASGYSTSGAAVVNTMDYITIATTGNAIDFGDLTENKMTVAGGSSSTRAVWQGGATGTGTSTTNVIEYVTIATTGNALDFGDLTVARRYLGGASNGTRAMAAGGVGASGSGLGPYNIIDYVTISTLGNAIDFGDLTNSRTGLQGVSSNTRAVMAGGITTGYVSTMDYFEFATLGNATSFGSLLNASGERAGNGGSSPTRGLFNNGYPSAYTNDIQYITIASTGNAIDFGDNTVTAYGRVATSSYTRSVMAGGHNSGTDYNVLDYVTIATQGNASDFGDLSQTRYSSGAASASHGGIFDETYAAFPFIADRAVFNRCCLGAA